MGNKQTLKIGAVRYRVGDRLYYVNCYGQQFYAAVIGCWDGETDGKPCLFIKRDEWYSSETWHPDNYIRIRHFPKGE